MKKLFIILLIFTVVAEVFGQTEYFQDMTRWQNFETEMRDLVVKCINLRKTNPTAEKFNITSSDGLIIQIDYIASHKTYGVHIIIRPAFHLPTNNYPLKFTSSLVIGATKTWEVMYGRPKQRFIEREEILSFEWVCSTWYYEADYMQFVDGTEMLCLWVKEPIF